MPMIQVKDIKFTSLLKLFFIASLAFPLFILLLIFAVTSLFGVLGLIVSSTFGERISSITGLAKTSGILSLVCSFLVCYVLFSALISAFLLSCSAAIAGKLFKISLLIKTSKAEQNYVNYESASG